MLHTDRLANRSLVPHTQAKSKPAHGATHSSTRACRVHLVGPPEVTPVEAAIIDAGELATNIGTFLPLVDARTAHDIPESSRPRPRGKIVLSARG